MYKFYSADNFRSMYSFSRAGDMGTAYSMDVSFITSLIFIPAARQNNIVFLSKIKFRGIAYVGVVFWQTKLRLMYR